MSRFYGHFAAAYGTIWFCLMLFALLTTSHVNTGAFGMFGFPVIALIYAIVRSSAVSGQDSETEFLRERIRLLEAEILSRSGY
jgi:hypothetical protein